MPAFPNGYKGAWMNGLGGVINLTLLKLYTRNPLLCDFFKAMWKSVTQQETEPVHLNFGPLQ